MSDSQPCIDKLPGFELFQAWLDERFRGVEGDVRDIKETVGELIECVSTGNGEPSLKEQVRQNTAFREGVEVDRDHANRARRAATYGLGASALLLLLNLILHWTGVLPFAVG